MLEVCARSIPAKKGWLKPQNGGGHKRSIKTHFLPIGILLLAFVALSLIGCSWGNGNETDMPADMAPATYQPDLVELDKLEPSLKLDIKYATPNNFVGKTVYPEARAFLLRPAAEALRDAAIELKKHGYGIVVFDAYRPWSVTLLFWQLTPSEKRHFVAVPCAGSVHNRGYAVDVSLYDLKTGKELPMPSGYDEMNEKAYPDYQGGSAIAIKNRQLLRTVMESKGFTVYQFEWWHYNYRGWEKHPIMNVPFNKL